MGKTPACIVSTGARCRICEELGSQSLPGQPTTIEGYDELDLVLRELQIDDPEAWLAVVRWYISHDTFYNTTRVSMLRGVVNPASGLPIFERQWVLERQQELEENPERPLIMGRGMVKSSTRIIQNVMRILRWPEVAIALLAFQVKAARKRLASHRYELENKLLVATFPEVLYERPRDKPEDGGADSWSLTDGLNVKRDTSRGEHTLEAHALKLHTLPTGSHFNVLDVDDGEDDKSVKTPDAIADLKFAYAQAQHLWSPPIERLFTGTPYHQAGLVAQKMKQPSAMIYPGEDFDTPGDGPLGGTPVYFTKEELWALYEEIGDPDSYAMQVCLSTSRGSGRQLTREQWTPYTDHPLDFGSRCFVYICVDPTRGLGDNAGIWVWGTTRDKRFAWLDAIMGDLQPGEQLEAIWSLCAKWSDVSLGVRHIRIEESGQANFAEPARDYLRRRGVYVDVYRCAVPPKDKMERAYAAWHPLASEQRLLCPSTPIMGNDNDGKRVNLVDYFFDFEWEQYPRPSTDNLLDAGALIQYPAKKMTKAGEKERPAGSAVPGVILFPNKSDLEMAAVEREGDRVLRYADDGRSYLSRGCL